MEEYRSIQWVKGIYCNSYIIHQESFTGFGFDECMSFAVFENPDLDRNRVILPMNFFDM